MLKTTLLVYVRVPEKFDFYLIPNEDIQKNNWLSLMKEAHNKFANTDDFNDGMAFLNEAVSLESKENDICFVSDRPEWRCCFAKYKVADDVMLDYMHITRVVFSGFIRSKAD